MRVWRIVRAGRVRDAWTPPRGDHRWTTQRSLVTYASLEPGMAVAEKLAYVRTVDQLEGFVLVEGNFEGSVARLDRLPSAWSAWPHDAFARRLGDAWATARQTPGLLVPSVLLPGENIVLNQEHDAFAVETVAVHGLDAFVR